jgi:hypothetical protein
LLPNRIVEHGTVDDAGRRSASAKIEYRLHIRRADTREHLVRPAEGMRCDDDIVEF